MVTFINHKKGEIFCGDRFLSIKKNGHSFYIVIDGIGHGQKASHVADIAYHAITSEIDANSSLVNIIKACEAALADTRGIAVSFVKVNHNQEQLEYCSVGNIESILIHANGSINLKRTPGVFGAKKYPITISVLPFTSEASLLMCSDGVGEITGSIRQQLGNLNTRHIVNLLSKQWQGQDDICILCEKLNYELH
jgi:serine phosphatase RsbU (regulator of sigma subunit)